MRIPFLKKLLPDRPMPLPILRGPFRGAMIQLVPRYSLRKVFGFYEHELNPWLTQVLPHITLVLDVGAYDGYFTFGCRTVLERWHKTGQILAFEPLPNFFQALKTTLANHSKSHVHVELHNHYVGSEVREGITTLDAIAQQYGIPQSRDRALIKIDVEGAELEVIAGAAQWLHPRHFYLIEVHDASFLEILTQMFAKQGIKLKQVNQQPLPILGREQRSPLNWWLISDL